MAQKTGKMRHTHKYYRGPDGLWYCALENCSHFMPKNVSHQVEGKLSICWNEECRREFILTKLLMERDKPFCAGCMLGVDEDQLEKYLKEKGL